MNMNKSTVAVLAAWLVAASLLATGDACTGKSMDMYGACHAVTTTPVLFDICLRTLRRTAPEASDVASYAVGAAGAAAQSCGSSMDAMDGVLRVGRRYPGDVQAAVTKCKASYVKAKAALDGVKEQLGRCSFAGFEKGYMDAVAAIGDGACSDNGPVGKTSLYGMVSSDRNMITIALRLGKLVKA